MDTNNNMLMDELKQDIERERWLSLWTRYRMLILGILALVILGTAAHSGWQQYARQHNMKLTDALYNAISPETAQKPDETATALSNFAAANAGTDAAFMAEMQAAGLLLNADDKAGAAQHLQNALAMKGADDNLRAIATLQYVQLVLETADAATLYEQLKPYDSASSPYRFQAWELMALAASRAGDKTKAQLYAGKIIDDKDALASARTRAQNLQRAFQ